MLGEGYAKKRQEYYERRAAGYDDAYRGAGFRLPGHDQTELQALERRISELPPRRTLDVACGTGFLTRYPRGEVVGLDASEAMLRIARQRVPETTFVRGDAFALPFPDASFERVFVANFYGLLRSGEREGFLEETRRVAPELVVVETARQEGMPDEGWWDRSLSDGSRYEVYRRYFAAEGLAEEVGGRALLSGGWFVMASVVGRGRAGPPRRA